MKKLIAIALLLASVCMLTAAAAQDIEIHREEELFYIVITLPSGARVADSRSDGSLSMTQAEFITAGKPVVIITVAPDETYVGQSLTDLTATEVEQIVSNIAVEMTQPSVDIRLTPDGHEYLIVNESTSANDTCDTVMLVNGYFIIVNVSYADFRELTPEDEEIGPTIVETLRFVGNTNS